MFVGLFSWLCFLLFGICRFVYFASSVLFVLVVIMFGCFVLLDLVLSLCFCFGLIWFCLLFLGFDLFS